MTWPERIGWLLAVVCCVGLPLLSDEPALALVGGGALLLAWLLIAPWRGGEGRSQEPRLWSLWETSKWKKSFL